MKVLIEMFSMNYRKLSAPQLFSATLVAACASAALNAGQAKALVTYEFIQQGSDVVMNVSGSVSVAPTVNVSASFGNVLNPSFALMTPKFIRRSPAWDLNGGPSNFGSDVTTRFTSYFGTSTFLLGREKFLMGTSKNSSSAPADQRDPLQQLEWMGPKATPGPIFRGALIIENYTLGSPISSSGLLAGQTLASLGFGSTAPGLLASWNIAGSSETVEVRIGSNAPSSVPGPLPLLGAAAAFAHSRRLRARLRAGSSSPLT